jgi:hypothetical protein
MVKVLYNQPTKISTFEIRTSLGAAKIAKEFVFPTLNERQARRIKLEQNILKSSNLVI